LGIPKSVWSLLATLAGPVVGGVIAALSWRAHPVFSIVVLVVAVSLAAVAGITRAVWRVKYQDRLVDWIGSGLDRRLSGFGRRYRRHLISSTRFTDLKGLVGRTFDPDLADVYVDVALRPRDQADVLSSDLRAQTADLPTAGERCLIEDFLGSPQPRVLAVIGAPGSGKTTLLRHTARQTCTRGTKLKRGRRDTPILLYLREHVATIEADPLVALPVLATSVLARYGLTEPPNWLESRLRAGRCLVLLDGLDEVAQAQTRKTVSEWVAMQVTRYPGNDFVVTSRPDGYRSAPIDGAITVQTQPFTADQIAQFVHSWYLAETRRNATAADPDLARRAAAEADDLLGRLRGVPALRALAANPLLLTMIAMADRHGTLPGSRAELYAHICQALLWRRHEEKKLSVEPRGEQKERLMRILAFEMMCRKVPELKTSDAVAILQPAMRRIARKVTADQFLEDAAVNGLFIELETEVRAFAHHTFQEYLAAAYIKDKNLQHVLTKEVGDTWWRETALLYVAGTDAGPLVEACLARNTMPALSLALDCAEEAGELAEDLQDKLEELLAANGDRERRELAGALVVARNLRHVVDDGNGSLICSQPITFRTYQFFLEDMASRGQHRLPDAPAELTAIRERAATGIRDSDAAAFVEWVNQITRGQQTYRRHEPASTERSPVLTTDTLSGHITADFAAAPLALGLMPLILPALAVIRILRVHGLDPDGAGGLAGLLKGARKIILDHLGQGELDLALALALTGDPIQADSSIDRDLNRALVTGLSTPHKHAPGTALEAASRLASAINISDTRLPDILQVASISARNVSRALGEKSTLQIARNFAHSLAGTSASCVFIGRALAEIAGDIGDDVLPGGVMEALASSFIAITLRTGEDYPILPDSLPKMARDSIIRLRQQLAVNSSLQSAAWAASATDRFESLMAPVIAREIQITSSAAASLRILGLCLAAEADALHDTDLSRRFRHIVAEVTWLQRRHSGVDHPSDTLMLAVDYT
jgi:hypothetical protein